MNKLLLICCCILISQILVSQDVYHTMVQDELQNQYGLPAGNWLLPDTEIETLNNDYAYGDIVANNEMAIGQLFMEKVSITVNNSGANPWDAGWGIQNTAPMQAGDAGLFVIWLRAENGDSQISLFVENAATYEKEVFLNFNVSANWTYYLIPFEANQAYSPGTLTFGAHIAWQPQSIEIGGVAALNYGQGVALEDLPSLINNNEYGGWEPNAPWRIEAANRIEAIRKANLDIIVRNADGYPIADAVVHVKMLQHDFAFGTAVVSRLFAGNPGQNNTYESKLLDLDGEGHGFNWVVFENALKWPGWEQNWITSKPQTANATEWLVDHNIKIRGHNLLWPGWSNLPPDIQNNQNNPAYIEERIANHIEAINTYPGIAGNIEEWDVLNEITSNRDLEYALQGQPTYTTGREIYSFVFEELAAVAPDVKAYLNDYVTISQANTGGGLYDLKKQFAQEIIDAGVSLDGIGFQAHIGGYPTSIYDVQYILDDFYNTFGTTAKITEYDTNEAVDDELAATYLRDFLTMVFSHESTDGFLMWGFWDGAHWKNNAPLFYEDWSLKPAGQTFIDLVFDEWWTEVDGLTDNAGNFSLCGFKGTYQVTIDCGEEIFIDTIELLHDTEIIKEGDALSLDTDFINQPGFNVFPNPANNHIYIIQPSNTLASIRLYNEMGQLVLQQTIDNRQSLVAFDLPKGIYTMIYEYEGERYVEKIVVRK